MPLKGSGLIRFSPPRELSARTVVTLGDAQDDSISDPKKITMKLHANRGYASATQLKRVPVDSAGGMSHLVNQVGQVLETCDVCRAFDKAPHIPIAGATAVSAFNEKVQVDLLFVDDLVVVHAMDVFRSTPFVARRKPKIPMKSGAFFALVGWRHLVPQAHSDGRGRRVEGVNSDGFLRSALR